MTSLECQCQPKTEKHWYPEIQIWARESTDFYSLSAQFLPRKPVTKLPAELSSQLLKTAAVSWAIFIKETAPPTATSGCIQSCLAQPRCYLQTPHCSAGEKASGLYLFVWFISNKLKAEVLELLFYILSATIIITNYQTFMSQIFCSMLIYVILFKSLNNKNYYKHSMD